MASGRILQTLFCTLNYDCIFEETLAIYMDRHRGRHPFTILRQVLNVKDSSFPLTAPSVLKLHGSVNYFSLVDLMGYRNDGPGFRDEGPHAIAGAIHAERLGDALRSYYREASESDSWRSPFIAHYAPGKPPNLTGRLRQLPQLWQQWVADSTAVIMIGVATESEDSHIWGVFHNWPGHVYDVNPNASRRLKRVLGDRYHHLPGKFVDAVDRYLPQLL